jgi:hypothetical protein
MSVATDCNRTAPDRPDLAASNVTAVSAKGRISSGFRTGRYGPSQRQTYWLYYPDSATLRGVPVAGAKGYHRDDWEGYQVRIDADADADARASSHHGFNYEQGEGNWASDLGFGPANAVAEAVGIRNGNGWGPETGFVFISGGSHAGNVRGSPGTRYTLRRYLRLVPLEPIAVGEQRAPYFAISPPWMKDAWFDPEAEGTD